MSDHETLIALHEAWQRESQTRRVRDQEFFRRYVSHKNTALYRKIQRYPTILAGLPITIQNDWRGIRRRPIGHTMLERYMPELGRAYLSEASAGSHRTFTEFLEHVLAICTCEQELKEYLHEQRLSAG